MPNGQKLTKINLRNPRLSVTCYTNVLAFHVLLSQAARVGTKKKLIDDNSFSHHTAQETSDDPNSKKKKKKRKEGRKKERQMVLCCYSNEINPRGDPCTYRRSFLLPGRERTRTWPSAKSNSIFSCFINTCTPETPRARTSSSPAPPTRNLTTAHKARGSSFPDRQVRH